MTTIPDTPTPSHEETAQAMLTQLRKLAQSIPGFTFVPPVFRRRLTASASVPDDFLQSIGVACDATPRLATASEITGAELRDTITFSRQYNSVADELELLMNGIRGTIAVRRSEVGRRALRAYEIAKRLDHPEDRERLVPHIEDMKRTLGRSEALSKAKRVKKAALDAAGEAAKATAAARSTDPPTGGGATPEFKAGKDLTS
jgi:hypothetical protein